MAIDAVDPNGAFVRLENKGEEDLALGGYKIVVKDEEREVTYKFGPKLILKPGKQANVSCEMHVECLLLFQIFSANSGERAHPQSHKLVLKNQDWPAGKNYRLTEVFDSEGQKIAHSESHRDNSGRLINSGADDRCCIM